MALNRHRWQFAELLSEANCWFEKKRRQIHRVSEKSAWWGFVWPFRQLIPLAIQKLLDGQHRFSPLKSWRFSDETVLTWAYEDRLMLHLIWKIIRPVANKIIPSRSYHLNGGCRKCLRDVEKTLKCQKFQYVIRMDVKSYYASIDRNILLQQLFQYFGDPMLRNYFDQIVNIPVDRNAEIINKTKGIPRRSTVSPFFGAIYLLPLLNALQQRKGCESFVFMDDVLVLIKTKKQYQRARKLLFQILNDLKLELSPKKTKMGKLKDFHFLGIMFRVSQNHENKNQPDVQLHSRTCARALDRVKTLLKNTVHPAQIQRYLILWSRWWASVLRPISYSASLQHWIGLCLSRLEYKPAWLGRGLLCWRLDCNTTASMRQCAELSL